MFPEEVLSAITVKLPKPDFRPPLSRSTLRLSDRNQTILDWKGALTLIRVPLRGPE